MNQCVYVCMYVMGEVHQHKRSLVGRRAILSGSLRLKVTLSYAAADVKATSSFVKNETASQQGPSNLRRQLTPSWRKREGEARQNLRQESISKRCAFARGVLYTDYRERENTNCMQYIQALQVHKGKRRTTSGSFVAMCYIIREMHDLSSTSGCPFFLFFFFTFL